MKRTMDVAIIGGGVIACSIAYFLTKHGITSAVFEQSHFGQGASSATAGVIGPVWHIDRSAKATFALGLRSLEMFPGLANQLSEAGTNPGFKQTGIAKLALTPEQVSTLQEDLIWQKELGLDFIWLNRDEVITREPNVTKNVLGAVFSPNEGHIEGQRYVDALVNAATVNGAVFHANTEILGLIVEGRKVRGIQTANHSIYCDQVVLAAGPWTGIANRWIPEFIPVRPVKGQHIILNKPGFLPNSAVRNFSGYVIPLMDHNVLVASTKEDGEFNQDVTVDSITDLIDIAVDSFPLLKDATFVRARAGVRPVSPDDSPILGPIPGWEGITIASGHSYIGVILSPATAELIADYIATGDATSLEPFNLSRFST